MGVGSNSGHSGRCSIFLKYQSFCSRLPQAHSSVHHIASLSQYSPHRGNIVRVDRIVMQLLWKQFLASGVRVADGEEADYFFVPIYLRMGTHSTQLPGLIKHISEFWPWWNRFSGARHLFVHSGMLGIFGGSSRLGLRMGLILSLNLNFRV